MVLPASTDEPTLREQPTKSTTQRRVAVVTTAAAAAATVQQPPPCTLHQEPRPFNNNTARHVKPAKRWRASNLMFAVLGVAAVGVCLYGRQQGPLLLPFDVKATSSVQQQQQQQQPPPPPPRQQETPPPVRFLTVNELASHDEFAASWWQRNERFVQLDIKDLHDVESDAFKTIWFSGNGKEDLRMAVDYLDFTVEHLSKWWKLTQQAGMLYMRRKLEHYMERSSLQLDNIMNSTLAIIPFGVSDKSSQETQLMWEAALAATIQSVWIHGVARIVVVGYYDNDIKLAARVFSTLSKQQVVAANQFETVVGATELAFVHTNDVNSKFVKENVPKGALKGLKDAMTGVTEPTPYLGKGQSSRFKYVYMTESDQILNARLSETFLAELDMGHIIVPHRLQPIPHAADMNIINLERKERKPKYVPNKTVVELDATTDGCCDSGDKIGYRPCGIFWWQCGLNDNGNFTHLEKYQFVTLTQGTGIVCIAATEHSRRCIPSVHSFCSSAWSNLTVPKY